MSPNPRMYHRGAYFREDSSVTQAPNAALPPAVFPIVFVVLLAAVAFTMFRAGRWSTLARNFPRPPGPAPHAVHRLAAMTVLPGIGYFNCVNLRADVRGLFVSVIPILNIGHPPLLIPWPDLTLEGDYRFLLAPQVLYRAGASEIGFSRFASAFIEAKRREFGGGPVA